MQAVVCATRGGEACRRTQERAIQLAQERGAELTFLYVADPSFVGPVDESLQDALEGEIARLGRALLRMAQGRAQKRGLAAHATVIQGPVQQGIKAYLLQVKAAALVLGTPQTNSTPQVFTADSIQGFAQAVREEQGIEVVVVT